jgi:hypothetical protein
MADNVERRNCAAIVWLHSKECTIDYDIPQMIQYVSVYGIEHVVKVIFSYIEIFAGAYQNNDLPSARVNFIKKYFGKVDSKYEKLGGLFYSVYRHGLIHDFHPKRFDYNNLHYEWQISKGNPEIHLTIFESEDDPKVRILHISLTKLYKDLKEAINLYFTDLEKNEEFRNNAGEKVARIQSRYEYKIKPLDYKIKSKKKKKVVENELNKVIEIELYTNDESSRSYISPSELEYLKSLESE